MAEARLQKFLNTLSVYYFLTVEVHAIVLNWNNYEDTRECVRSLLNLDYDNLNIWIVDNGSTDNSTQHLESSYSEVENISILNLPKNLGFAAGMNQGIKAAMLEGGEAIWLLNNDVFFPDNFQLASLVSILESDTKIGVVSPVICDPDGHHLFTKGKIRWKKSYAKNLNTPISTETRIEYLPLTAALIDTDVLSEVMLPEEYFLYWEDVDWSVRIQEHGWNIVVTPSVELIHEPGSSSNSAVKSYYTARNRWIFYRKHRQKCGPFLRYYIWMMALLSMGKILRGDIQALFALWLGVYDGATGQNGKGRYP